jgi:integrase
MLTDYIVEHAKPGPKAIRLSDSRGLYLAVLPNGSKLWRLDFRFDGRRLTASFGPYPDISLEAAREANARARTMIRAGLNPIAERRVALQTAKIARATTFGLVADELLEKLAREEKAPATVGKRAWLLKELAAPLADRPVNAITPVEILSVLRNVEGKGHLETARRLRASIGQVMRLAIATGRATSDPTPALRGAIAAPKTTHRAAITDKPGARRLMQAIDGYNRPIVKAAMEIMAYCFPRPGECRLARWPEVDLDAAVWIIPAARTKMRREHRIPLSRQAVAAFRTLHRYSGHWNELCFPGQRSHTRPISENTICVALRSLGFASEEMSAHGFRALASTLLHENSKFSSAAIERALAHQDPNAIRRAYARGEHWDERVQLMQWWADYLDALRDAGEVKPPAAPASGTSPVGAFQASMRIVNVKYG